MKVKKVGIVSLSRGVLGEDFVRHEVDLGLKRLRDEGIEVVFLPNARKGIDYLEKSPQARAQDLLRAFEEDSIDMILCAIGGIDTYRLLPYLFDHGELRGVLKEKIFLGFSDTTVNHFMLHKLGLKTFYGQAFLPDVCELSKEMLPYSKKYFQELVSTGRIKKVEPSDYWYEERKDFSLEALGQATKAHPNQGFISLQGPRSFQGKILGGCLETIYSMISEEDFPESYSLCEKYQIFPSLEEWKDKILLLETSENKSKPEYYRKMIKKLKERGVMDVVAGLLVGKPQDECYWQEYQKILLEELKSQDLPIAWNINIGHGTPRCILPFGELAKVDLDQQVISFSVEEEDIS